MEDKYDNSSEVVWTALIVAIVSMFENQSQKHNNYLTPRGPKKIVTPRGPIDQWLVDCTFGCITSDHVVIIYKV